MSSRIRFKVSKVTQRVNLKITPYINNDFFEFERTWMAIKITDRRQCNNF